MKTEVIMKRELFGCEISQQSKSEFFSATELIAAGNLYREKNGMSRFNLSQFLSTNSTLEFIKALEQKTGSSVVNVSRGRKGNTWVHPLLFIDIALAISPTLKIEVYEWLLDSLLKYRNLSGDTYNLMCAALWEKTTRKGQFADDIKKLALMIKKECGVSDWQHATESQLAKRDKIHNNIALLANVMNNNREAIRLGILEAKKQF